MKKIITLLLLAIMALSLVSCGSSEGGDGVTVTWLVPGDAQKDTNLVVDEINKIMEELTADGTLPALAAKYELTLA